MAVGKKPKVGKGNRSMQGELSRRELEEIIVQYADAIDLMKPNASWLDDEEFEAFLESWRNLKRFYAEHNDTVVGIEILREYVDYTRLLRRVISDEISEEYREKAKDALESIEYLIDEIIREGVTNLENQFRVLLTWNEDQLRLFE